MENYAKDRLLDDIAAVHTNPAGQTFDAMVTLLKERYAPTRNITVSHFDFHCLRQKVGQSFDDFVNQVKNAAKPCEFKCVSNACTVAATLIRDQVIIGANNEEFRKNALKGEWKLTAVESEWRQAEAAVVGAAVLREVVEGKVERVHPKKYSRKYQASKTERDKSKEESKFQCFSCGRSRCDRKNCPAKTSKCNRCGRKGHWARSVD